MPRLLLAALALPCLAAPLRAGDIDPPPGPVAPTMKTIEEAQPRVPVDLDRTPGDADSIYRIVESGSYYLTSDVVGEAGKAAIEIAQNDVTLDLNGFTLFGVTDALSGVRVLGPHKDITVRNGVVRGWPADGIDLYNADNSAIHDVRAYDNEGFGLAVGLTSSISRCEAGWNDVLGIKARFGSRITDCSASYQNAGPGIEAEGGAVIARCTAIANAGPGIVALHGSEVVACAANVNLSHGIEARSGTTVRDCTVFSNGTGNPAVAGVFVPAPGVGDDPSPCRIEGNHATANGTGIKVAASNGTFVLCNTAGLNMAGGNYDVAAGNRMGPVSTDPATAGPWANFEL